MRCSPWRLLATSVAVLWGTIAVARLTDDDPEKNFQQLIEEAKKAPEKADFNKLRMAYAKTGAFNPYSTDKPDIESVQKETNNGERAAAIQAIDRLLEGRWLDIEAQAFAAAMCKKVGASDRETLHRAFMNGLITSILNSGDGTTPEKAFVVITIPEEYVILKVMGMESTGQALMVKDGHQYDVHTCTNPELDEKAQVHFNIDIPKKWLRRKLKSDVQNQ